MIPTLKELTELFQIPVQILGVYEECPVHESDFKQVSAVFKRGYGKTLLPCNKAVCDMVYGQDSCDQYKNEQYYSSKTLLPSVSLRLVHLYSAQTMTSGYQDLYSRYNKLGQKAVTRRSCGLQPSQPRL